MEFPPLRATKNLRLTQGTFRYFAFTSKLNAVWEGVGGRILCDLRATFTIAIWGNKWRVGARRDLLPRILDSRSSNPHLWAKDPMFFELSRSLR